MFCGELALDGGIVEVVVCGEAVEREVDGWFIPIFGEAFLLAKIQTPALRIIRKIRMKTMGI